MGENKERDYAILHIKFYMGENKVVIESDLDKIGQKTILEEFLTERVGAEVSKDQFEERDVYEITLRYHPNNNIHCSHNMGSEELRDEILYVVLKEYGDLEENLANHATKKEMEGVIEGGKVGSLDILDNVIHQKDGKNKLFKKSRKRSPLDILY